MKTHLLVIAVVALACQPVLSIVIIPPPSYSELVGIWVGIGAEGRFFRLEIQEDDTALLSYQHQQSWGVLLIDNLAVSEGELSGRFSGWPLEAPARLRGSASHNQLTIKIPHAVAYPKERKIQLYREAMIRREWDSLLDLAEPFSLK